MLKTIFPVMLTLSLVSCSTMSPPPSKVSVRTIASEPNFLSFNSTNYQRMINLSDPDGMLKKSIRGNLNLIKEQIAIVASLKLDEVEVDVRLDVLNTGEVDQELKQLYAILEKLKFMARTKKVDSGIFYEINDQVQKVVDALNSLKDKYDHISIKSPERNQVNQVVLNIAKKKLGLNANIRVDAVKDSPALYRWGHNNIKLYLDMNIDNYGSFNYMAQAFQPAQDLSKGVVPMNTFLGVDTYAFDTKTCSNVNPEDTRRQYVDNYVTKASDYVTNCSALFRSPIELYANIFRGIRVFARIEGSCHELESSMIYNDVCEQLTVPRGKKIVKFFRGENCNGVLTNMMSENSNCEALGLVNESRKYDLYNFRSYSSGGVCNNVGYSQRLTKDLCEDIKREK